MPRQDYTSLIDLITREHDCSTVGSNDEVICICDSEFDTSFPPLTFQLVQQNLELTLTSNWYLRYESNFEGKQGCVLQLKTAEKYYWQMGTPFLRAFLTIFDQKNSRIGFAPAVDTELEQLKAFKQLVLIITAIVIVMIVVLIVIGVCCYLQVNKNKQAEAKRKAKEEAKKVEQIPTQEPLATGEGEQEIGQDAANKSEKSHGLETVLDEQSMHGPVTPQTNRNLIPINVPNKETVSPQNNNSTSERPRTIIRYQKQKTKSNQRE